MLEATPRSLIGRMTDAASRHGLNFGPLTGQSAEANPNPVLMWLAGAGYQPKAAARRLGLIPMAKGADDAASTLLATTKPDDPVLAARMRADILASLYREAPSDPRVQDIFDADPILAADPRTGWLVTESMMEARIGLINSLNTLLQQPDLTAKATAELRRTLIEAFTYLSPDSQREWCHSEIRLEQGLDFLESREPSDLLVLADTLDPIFEERGIWDSLRLFSVAAQMNDVANADPTPVANLLMMSA